MLGYGPSGIGQLLLLRAAHCAVSREGTLMLERMLKSFVKTGKLTIIRPGGTRFAAGHPR